MHVAQMVIVVASYPDPQAAEASRLRLADEKITAHILPKVPGWLGRVLGRRERYHLGVDPANVAKAKALLH